MEAITPVAFPTLDEAQIEKLGRCAGASLKHYRDGQPLFRVGEREFKFFVVKSGEVEIMDESGETPKTITVHRPGEFTGDVVQLTGSPAIVSAIARGDSEVYEVAAEAVRQVLNTCPDLGEIVLQAFIARRQLLRESGDFTGLRVIGSRYSQDTFRIRDFLSRNRDGLLGVYPHRSGFDAAAMDIQAAAVLAGDELSRRICCGRRSIGFGQAGRFSGRRGRDGGAVCGRVFEGDVSLHEESRTAIR